MSCHNFFNKIIEVAELLETELLCNFIHGHIGIAEKIISNAATMRIRKSHQFERRVGIWPAGFDQDGELFRNQRYGDWPMPVEQKIGALVRGQDYYVRVDAFNEAGITESVTRK